MAVAANKQPPPGPDMTKKFFIFPRLADGDTPAGLTVSKTKKLPEGDFGIDEYEWPDAVLWFVADHKFTKNERQAAHDSIRRGRKLKAKVTQ